MMIFDIAITAEEKARLVDYYTGLVKRAAAMDPSIAMGTAVHSLQALQLLALAKVAS